MNLSASKRYLPFAAALAGAGCSALVWIFSCPNSEYWTFAAGVGDAQFNLCLAGAGTWLLAAGVFTLSLAIMDPQPSSGFVLSLVGIGTVVFGLGAASLLLGSETLDIAQFDSLNRSAPPALAFIVPGALLAFGIAWLLLRLASDNAVKIWTVSLAMVFLAKGAYLWGLAAILQAHLR